ncbi:hypothetical protein [Parasediminibacterium sp. JCM 36343]|uniref:hypothetical protein n=1 Tax=Parasediminibacterium sp. JCM 36343 TaxID=3374279 RepID=UPI00397E6369
MIQLLADKYQRVIAFLMYAIFCLSMAVPSYARPSRAWASAGHYAAPYKKVANREVAKEATLAEKAAKPFAPSVKAKPVATVAQPISARHATSPSRVLIGGPNQPEMSSFKSIGADNMVNLFSGDFSYNIPLMDVGGYPINMFYTGGVNADQEASWVGLGWNINPGNINRNMRGIPDDFDGTDLLVQAQKMKKNKTWGFSVGGDLELVGIKAFKAFTGSVGLDLGVSFNNYLGPALDLNVKGTTSFKMAGSSASEKSPGSISAGIGLDLNSRNGLTISPNVSLTANANEKHSTTSFGVGLSTSYNSRSGIKALKISEQVSFSAAEKAKCGEDSKGKVSESIFSNSISFAKPSYIPSIRMPLTNSAFSGHVQYGGAIFGVAADVETEVYCQSSEVADGDVTQTKPMVGYLYYQDAINNANAVMDFTRFNDKEVMPGTPIISAPQYTYDVFSIQGEGTGGSIRAYRNDLGFVRDNMTISRDKSFSLGFDADIPGHFGGNFNTISTPSTVGGWVNGNKLRTSTNFKTAHDTYENVYFRNPGESSVLTKDQFDAIGGTDLVRFRLSGDGANPSIEPVLDMFSTLGYAKGVAYPTRDTITERKKRTQVINFLTAKQADAAGLDKKIKSYSSTTLLGTGNILACDSFSRMSEYRKDHHISQINVTEANGKRYVYGIPVYNISQEDFTFSVDGMQATDGDKDKVAVNDSNWMKAGASPLLADGSKKDGYVESTQTPAYAHSFLLSGLLSPDYVDVTGDGITDDDLGSAVKFNYTRIKNSDGSWSQHKWRTPLTQHDSANFNPGNRSETKDDKGIVSYGVRESWYVHSIESKTMIAVFRLSNRDDGKGPVDHNGGVYTSDNSLKKLDRIDLYNKADLKANGTAGAKPVKSVVFQYSYGLCKGTPDNPTTGEGKLTLDSIYFSFNGHTRSNKNKYVFSYTDKDKKGNPDYMESAADRWGTYKPSTLNPAGMKNSLYPYSIQDKAAADTNAGAWSLKRILLPSGGQIEVNYESDDYAYVQNLRAAGMLHVTGFGVSPTSTPSNQLYNPNGADNDYVFVKVPKRCNSVSDAYQQYLQGISQVAVKLPVYMPKAKGVEYIASYATINGYGVTSDPYTIWVHVDEVDGHSPFVLTALEYLRQQLPGQAFGGYDVSESSGLLQVADMLKGFLDGLKGAFGDPINHFKSQSKAMTVNTDRCFARFNNPDGFKYGGGHRVKSVMLKDNWDKMTGQYNSTYGQVYDYTTTEVFNGAERVISSGVASYEPSIGGEENPFQAMLQVSDRVPLGPASYGSVEMPVLDAFFPAPSVGYSKVTVRSLQSITYDPTIKKTRSGIGKQVTEYYTAKDYPVYYSNTALDPASDRQSHASSSSAFFYKYQYDYRALSQGFLVATNDMHGKMKSQSSYPENDTATRISYTENFYSNTGNKGLGQTYDFISNAKGGEISAGNMGIDVELMTDAREFSVQSNSLEVQAQADLFPIIFPFWIPTIWPVSGNSENTYRAVTTTKVVSYHSILDSVVVIDKGSHVSTNNLVYDAETGNVVVNQTNNEFNQPIYTTSYPAYWAYSGMGLAYKNIGAVYSGINFSDGKIVNTGFNQSIFESGDELLVQGAANASPDCHPVTTGVSMLWAYDTAKNSSSLTNPSPQLVFMDASGKLYTNTGVTFTIIRSGHRNMLDAQASSVTSMASPLVTVAGVKKLAIGASSNVINASASEYKEKWQVDHTILPSLSTVPYGDCGFMDVQDCNGDHLERVINPYRKGLLGSFKPFQSKIFYGDRQESNPSSATNLPTNGYLSSFKLYWDFNSANNLVPDLNSSKWVWNSQLAKVNAKSQELETKNALGIYTAAQYGYDKSLPVAITSNSRSSESAFEGFEDNAYNCNLDMEDAENCSNYKQFDLSALGTVVSLKDSSFSAHSGKSVLRVDANRLLTLPITSACNDYNFKLLNDTIRKLTNPGNNVKIDWKTPSCYTDTVNVATYDDYSKGMELQVGQNTDLSSFCNTEAEDPITGSSSFEVSENHYIKIDNDGLYNIDFGININNSHDSSSNYYYSTSYYIDQLGAHCALIESNNGLSMPVAPGVSCIYDYFMNEASFDFNLTSLADKSNPTIIWDGSTTTLAHSDGSAHATMYLKKGVYQIIDTCKNQHSDYFEFVAYTGGIEIIQQYLTFFVKVTNACYPSVPIPGYKTSISNGCTSTTPIPADSNMLNPTFSIPPNQKMVFSAWVRESCTASPCVKASYDSNQVRFVYNTTDGSSIDSVTIKPSGGVIDGWQRYEGYFTAPANATSMGMKFINKSSSPIYFDDIRIHPYNANMKSYVYDPINLRLVAELDANNYATFYEYDEEGTLVRTKAETKQGIKTIKETRSAKQKQIDKVVD